MSLNTSSRLLSLYRRESFRKISWPVFKNQWNIPRPSKIMRDLSFLTSLLRFGKNSSKCPRLRLPCACASMTGVCASSVLFCACRRALSLLRSGPHSAHLCFARGLTVSSTEMASRPSWAPPRVWCGLPGFGDAPSLPFPGSPLPLGDLSPSVHFLLLSV